MRTLGGRYRLEVPLGSGGMAVVWRATDLVLGRPVAVKLLAPSLADRVSRARIRAEAQVAARLAHPNVASVYDYGESRRGPRTRVPYIVMELVDGDTLATHHNGEPMHWRTAVGIAAEVAAALAAAHAVGVVHRDVKPGNIMLARTGVKVVDFGIAAAIGALEDGDGELLGTPAYVAPERFAGEPAVPATDVYALGVVLYQCLTGTLPWKAATVSTLIAAHRALPPDPLPAIDGLPADVVELCEQCLRKEPDERPGSLYVAMALAEAVGTVLTLPPVDSAAAATTRPAPSGSTDDVTAAVTLRQPGGSRRPRSRRAAALAGAAGVLAAAAAVAAHVFTSGARGEPVVEAAAPPPGGCVARYVARYGTGGDFTAEVSVTNTGARALPRWSLTFALPAGQRLTRAEGARIDQHGEAVTLLGEAPLRPGDTRRLNLAGTHTNAGPAPTRFTLDGAACAPAPVADSAPVASPDGVGSAPATRSVPAGTGARRTGGPASTPPAPRRPATSTPPAAPRTAPPPTRPPVDQPADPSGPVAPPDEPRPAVPPLPSLPPRPDIPSLPLH